MLYIVAMQFLIAPCLLLALYTGASAQNSYYAERGHWTVASGSTSCSAFNRPLEEFNHSPFNGLQIVVERGFRIGVYVMFWPGAVEPDRDYELLLTFDNVNVIPLAATAFGDYALAVDPAENHDLWKQVQTANDVAATVVGEEQLATFFVLDDSAGVAKSLRDCMTILPPPS